MSIKQFLVILEHGAFKEYREISENLEYELIEVCNPDGPSSRTPRFALRAAPPTINHEWNDEAIIFFTANKYGLYMEFAPLKNPCWFNCATYEFTIKTGITRRFRLPRPNEYRNGIMTSGTVTLYYAGDSTSEPLFLRVEGLEQFLEHVNNPPK